jgi:hypothetical protein
MVSRLNVSLQYALDASVRCRRFSAYSVYTLKNQGRCLVLLVTLWIPL